MELNTNTDRKEIQNRSDETKRSLNEEKQNKAHTKPFQLKSRKISSKKTNRYKMSGPFFSPVDSKMPAKVGPRH